MALEQLGDAGAAVVAEHVEVAEPPHGAGRQIRVRGVLRIDRVGGVPAARGEHEHQAAWCARRVGGGARAADTAERECETAGDAELEPELEKAAALHQ